MIVEAKVTGVNKNKTGLLVEVNGIKGFMPISQIDMYRVEKPEDYVNQRIKCEVTEVDPAGAEPGRQPAGAARAGAGEEAASSSGRRSRRGRSRRASCGS